MTECSIHGIPASGINQVIGAAPAILDGLLSGKSTEDIVTALEPAAISTIEFIANFLFPGAGTIIEILVVLAANTKTMTQEETNAWMNRSGRTSSDNAY